MAICVVDADDVLESSVGRTGGTADTVLTMTAVGDNVTVVVVVTCDAEALMVTMVVKMDTVVCAEVTGEVTTAEDEAVVADDGLIVVVLARTQPTP